MNLVINARDAMPGGGQLTLATCHGPHPAGIPGDFVILSVSDTGCGLDDKVKHRIFDPFFTTKSPGQGTGLGLATCQTILRQCHGYITVASELDKGTCFTLYFPRLQEAVPSSKTSPQAFQGGGSETLLVVEDESALLVLAGNALKKLGYEVLCAADGREGLQVAQQWKGPPIQLVVTDLVMPRMGGKAMAEWLQVDQPNLKFLFTSGYADESVPLQPGMAFLPKPYTPATLARVVRQLLDETLPL